jgi:FMN phosphatase YigB (HAD superfamily)
MNFVPDAIASEVVERYSCTSRIEFSATGLREMIVQSTRHQLMWPNIKGKVHSAVRLAHGAARIAFRRNHDADDIDLISVDVFGTILARTSDDDAAWRASSVAIWPVLFRHGIVFSGNIEQLRSQVEAALTADLLKQNQCPEFSHERSFEALLQYLGAGGWAGTEAKALAAIEMEFEARLTRPVAPMAAWIAEQVAAGRRVIAVSDTRYSGEEVAELLRRHKVHGIAKVYSSADRGFNKFSGKLFDVVLQEEKVSPGQILHSGDNLLSDYFPPAQRGLNVRHTPRPAVPPCSSPLPCAPLLPVDNTDDGYRVGYETIGPVLVAFTRLLLLRAQREGVERLAFVARDGSLLLDIAREIVAASPGWKPELSYVQLSRRVTACAAPELTQIAESPVAIDHLLRKTFDLAGEGTLLERVCSLFNLPIELLSAEAERFGLQPSQMKAVGLRALLSDRRTAEAIRDCVVQQQKILLRYLQQEQILSDRTALVDVGWRASIQRAINKLPRPDGSTCPVGYYIGLWDEGRMVQPGGVSEGILCDQRRQQTLLESAALRALFVIESVCRADHGMVIGFEDQGDGTVAPVHIHSGPMRDAERHSWAASRSVREGILAYARWFAGEAACMPPFEKETRRAAQRRLFQLAFFPRPEERALGRALVHTEPTTDNWFAPLIMSSNGGVKGWLSGMRSPWKGGYFQETGGFALAALYCLAEGAFITLPPGSKQKLRSYLLGEK